MRGMTEPIILSTWSFGQRANRAAFPTLASGGSSLDAVEIACKDAETDPDNHTVGFSGYPDANGKVSLDASIMLSPKKCGSVALVRRHVHAISVARLVMEKTPHVLIAGISADELASQHGIKSMDLLSDKARDAWESWKRKTGGKKHGHRRNIEELGLKLVDAHNDNHDTIGCIAIDRRGVLAGGCTTSGLAFKLPGRIGDSPIIGHGLYVDPKYGAAVATGHGELVMGVCGSFLAVESLRNGDSARKAATNVIKRIAKSYDLTGEDQVGVIVLARDGSWGSASLRPGFRVAMHDAKRDALLDAHHVEFE